MESGMRTWIKFIIALLFFAVIAAAGTLPSSCSGSQCDSVMAGSFDSITEASSSSPSPSAAKDKKIGSQHPSCVGKCGKCTPCKTVFKKVPPKGGDPGPYAPGIWRCRCNRKNYPPF